MTDFIPQFTEENTDGLNLDEIMALKVEFQKLWPHLRRAKARLPRNLQTNLLTNLLESICTGRHGRVFGISQ